MNWLKKLFKPATPKRDLYPISLMAYGYMSYDDLTLEEKTMCSDLMIKNQYYQSKMAELNRATSNHLLLNEVSCVWNRINNTVSVMGHGIKLFHWAGPISEYLESTNLIPYSCSSSEARNDPS